MKTLAFQSNLMGRKIWVWFSQRSVAFNHRTMLILLLFAQPPPSPLHTLGWIIKVHVISFLDTLTFSLRLFLWQGISHSFPIPLFFTGRHFLMSLVEGTMISNFCFLILVLQANSCLGWHFLYQWWWYSWLSKDLLLLKGAYEGKWLCWRKI